MKQKNLVLIVGIALVLVMTFSVVSAGWFTGKAVDYSSKIYKDNTRTITGTSSKITIGDIDTNTKYVVISIDSSNPIEMKIGETKTIGSYNVYIEDIGKTLFASWVKIEVTEAGDSEESGVGGTTGVAKPTGAVYDGTISITRTSAVYQSGGTSCTEDSRGAHVEPTDAAGIVTNTCQKLSENNHYQGSFCVLVCDDSSICSIGGCHWMVYLPEKLGDTYIETAEGGYKSGPGSVRASSGFLVLEYGEKSVSIRDGSETYYRVQKLQLSK
jgi:hypothetical protein